MVLSGKQSSILFWKPCSIAMIKIILEVYNKFLSHLRMTLGPELLIGRNANYFYLFGFFQVKIYDCTPWKYFHCNIFFTYIYFTFLYENVCNVFAQFFYMCWINVLLIKHFLVDYLFHLCGDFLFSLGGIIYPLLRLFVFKIWSG